MYLGMYPQLQFVFISKLLTEPVRDLLRVPSIERMLVSAGKRLSTLSL